MVAALANGERQMAVRRASLLMVAALGALSCNVANAQSTTTELPADPNLASLRINALMSLYEFDMSPGQLKELRAAAVKTAGNQARPPVKGTAALAQAFKDVQSALEKRDEQAIVEARNKMVELTSDLDLDDDVNPTEAALAKAPAIRRQLRASQIAAFLAVHADELSDPTELVLGALEAIRDLRDDNKNGAKNGEIATLITQTGQTAGYLVFGTDSAKANGLASRISAWLKSTSELGAKEYDAQQSTQEEAVQKIIGDADPMDVLSHWLNFRIAQLLSNPELPGAINSALAAGTLDK
jgi:hypothetical protein